MRSFSELLREYTARTGVSDTELARALGVRRQTIFRWKEGLVEKPRSREDVLRCATKLRLSPEERDEFLLSAGFAPESPPLTYDDAHGEAEPEDRSRPVQLPAPVTDGVGAKATQPRHLARRTLFLGIASALVGLILVAGWIIGGFGLPGSNGDVVAPAASGETLVIVGASPEPVGRAASARVKAAIDREAQAGRVGQLRVAVWPEEIRDPNAATAAVKRTGATLVISIAATPDDQLDSTLLTRGPGGAMTSLVQMKVRPTATQDTQAVALLVLAEVQAERGDVGLAEATALRTQESPLADADSEAAVAAYLDRLTHRP